MSNSTKSAARRKSSSANGWTKPYPDFPLSFHPPSGRLYKKIRGNRIYFGYAKDWQAAVDRYLDEKDDLQAGRAPRKLSGGLIVKDLLNRFLTNKQQQLSCGEIAPRTFSDYKATAERLVVIFGKNRLVDDLAADDFEALRADIATTRGPVALGNEVQRVRVVFKYAYDAGLIEQPIRYGPTFKKPNKRVLRKARNANGPRMFEANEIRRMLDTASPQMLAMILLGVNAGFGNSDCGTLPMSAVDLDGGWIDFPRPKTGIKRRSALWAETALALREVINTRSTPKAEENAGLVFLTKFGESWTKETTANPISAEFRKLLKRVDADTDQRAKKNGTEAPNKLYRKSRSFYSLRHTFETIGGESRDQVAVNYIMGHAPASNDMSAVYRERISDERLVAVTDYVREWLFGYAHILGYTDAAVTLAKQISEQAVQNGLDEEKWRSRKNPLWDALIGEKYLKESSGRDALDLAGDGDEAAMAWIRARDWGESKN